MAAIKQQNKEENVNNLIVVLVIVTVLISFVSLSVSYIKTSQLREKITGFAVGYVNVTIMTTISLNVSPLDVNFGPGTINTSGGWTNATLQTGHGADGNVSCGANPINGLAASGSECGNWTAAGTEGQMTKGFNLTNMGSVNASVNLSSAIRSANNLFGGNASNQMYQWKATPGKTNSCPGTINSSWNNIWTDSSWNNVCSNLGFDDNKDTIIVDIKVTVPYDANITSSRETRGDTLTFTATAKY